MSTPGERSYYSERGGVSFGESLGEAGMRMFYLFPEEFPELYGMREAKRRLPEAAVRRVLSIINGEGD